MEWVWYRILILALTGSLSLTSAGLAAVAREEAEDTARLLAALLDAGRVVVDRNQALIDDPRKGQKGFTPEFFEGQLRSEFRERTGVDLGHLDPARVPPLARELLPALVQASKEVVSDAQVVINQRGIDYKNFIPATFGSQAAARFSRQSSVRLKQTALHPRNPKNTPDAYETAVLRRLATQPSLSAPISELADEGKTLRVVSPIYYTKDCLKCHGGQSGEFDISGYPKEGAREGDLAGAISVTIPLDRR
ncbi:MAG: Tll0287-like domain-containing protein [Nitrospiraceae bacterium]